MSKRTIPVLITSSCMVNGRPVPAGETVHVPAADAVDVLVSGRGRLVNDADMAPAMEAHRQRAARKERERRNRPVYATDHVKKQLVATERKRRIKAIAEAIATGICIDADPEKPCDAYVLIDNHKAIARWREADHPGLAAWLMTRLHERETALLLARDVAGNSQKQVERAHESAKERDPCLRFPSVARQMRNVLERGESTRGHVAGWVKHGIPRSSVYYMIGKIRRDLTK